MRIFLPSQLKQAIAALIVQPADAPCQVEIFLGPNENTKTATSGLLSFTSTGLPQNVALSITMPAVSGIYHVYIDVYVAGVILAKYVATEDVAIASAQFGGITW